MMECFSKAESRLKPLIAEQITLLASRIPSPRRVLIKPNWVLHETDPAFPISALVTDARVIDAVIEACLSCFPSAESILIGDCPLQYSDWPLMCQQSGVDQLIEKYGKMAPGKVEFRDLRKEVYTRNGTTFLQAAEQKFGDPRGYREVNLKEKSHLAPIADDWEKFGVNDYSTAVTSSNHRPGAHKYFVSQSILDSDLFINVPKWKSHAKSGITCALKNLVGINGDKAYLPHFRKGAPKWGGDEFTDEHRWLYFAQTRLREKLQKRSKLAFRALKPGWELLKNIYGIETRVTDPGVKPKRFYVAGGSWYGNDTIWRMIYDLNYVIQCVDSSGVLQEAPQRTYFCIVDGLISGEGNGPLQPLPRKTDFLACGNDPFLIDHVLAWFMGFSPDKIPLLTCKHEYMGPSWGAFKEPILKLDGETVNLQNSPLNFKFVPASGWRDHIER